MGTSEQKHNRAKPMSESASALFSIADAGEFRFARFYSVCEEVPLGTPESPLIVCGLSDTLRECPNVAKTRNGMPDAAWKKYTNFASKICRRPFIPELSVPGCSCNIPYPPSLPYDSPLLGHAVSYATVSSNCELYRFA